LPPVAQPELGAIESNAPNARRPEKPDPLLMGRSWTLTPLPTSGNDGATMSIGRRA
jgi:hypothetical protein